MVNIIPRPLNVESKYGSYKIDEATIISLDSTHSGLMEIARQFKENVESASVFKLTILDEHKVPPAGRYIHFKLEGTVDQMGEEGYFLSVSPARINVRAATPAGMFYGMQTLRQLFPVSLEDSASGAESWDIPCVEIFDKPRFPWRGDMLDVSRHFLPKELIRKNLDYLARYKMNTFHWHLTDDQGWRIEIKKYPELTRIGAWRVDRFDDPWWGRLPAQPEEKATYGGFFTRDDIKEIVAYAARRHITIVPEIDMPGHSQATIAACPEISCDGGSYFVATGGVANGNTLCPGKEVTFDVIEDVLDEVLDLFPGPYFHVGGDECNKSAWKNCPDCQRRIREEGLKDENELQSYFIRRVEALVNARGKKLIGWDEILEGGLAPNAAVMSWRGESGGIEAARMGHDVVMTPTTCCYLDLKQGDPELEPPLGYSQCKLSTAYSYDPVPGELNEKEAGHILGSQGNLWGESIKNEEHMNYMLFPRLLAIAEVTWTPKERRQWEDFVPRLEHNLHRLDNMGIGYARSMYNVSVDMAPENNGSQFRIALNTEHGNVPVHYTLDGSEPDATSQRYEKPFLLKDSTVIRAAGFRDGRLLNKVSTEELNVHLAAGKKVKLEIPWNSKYPPGNTFTLTDCLRGGTSYNDGKWLGFEGDDLMATIDLGSITRISRVTIGCLDDQDAYIFLPVTIQVSLSDKGNEFKEIGFVTADSTTHHDAMSIQNISVPVKGSSARYVRIHARNLGTCPDWHVGAGSKAWLFVDEIIVE